MKRNKHWFVCLDLTSMDNILIGYTKFLTSEIEPEKITFIHVIKSGESVDELIELFPEIKDTTDIDKIIHDELREGIDHHFADSKIATELIIKEGRPTDEIVKAMESINPDLTIMGKKSGYKGKGVIPRKIMKYVSSSILFVPENSRYQLKKALVPTDFSEQSAKAVETAFNLTSQKEGTVTAQHVYNYPARFFPYMPEDDDEEKMENYLNEKKDEFVKNYSISDDVNFVFSLNIEGTKMDQIYDQVVRDQTDMIVASSKADKKIASIFREDFTDKMAYYRFGVPLLILKNKEKYQKFLKTLFSS
ncbi:MAG: universal stress protein [Balneolaceae bacterium]